MTGPVRPPALPGADPHDLMRRPGVITLLSVLFGVGGAFMLLTATAFVLPGLGRPALLAFGAGCLILAALDGVVTSPNGDIVFSNGQFIRAPAAEQSRATGRP